jgi:hypothetical protein
MRRRVGLLAGLAAAGALSVFASSASAAPIVDHFHATFSEVNPTDDLCGIDGSSVTNGMDNVQVFADGTVKDQGSSDYVFTSATTGKSVEIFFAQQFAQTLEVVNPDGSMTFIATTKGLPEKIKLPNGPVLSRDAGNVTFLNTFDADGNFLSQTVVDVKGPHPDLASGFTLMCDVIIPALS